MTLREFNRVFKFVKISDKAPENAAYKCLAEFTQQLHGEYTFLELAVKKGSWDLEYLSKLKPGDEVVIEKREEEKNGMIVVNLRSVKC